MILITLEDLKINQQDSIAVSIRKFSKPDEPLLTPSVDLAIYLEAVIETWVAARQNNTAEPDAQEPGESPCWH